MGVTSPDAVRRQTVKAGFFFIHPPAAIVAQFPQFPVHGDYASLRASFDAAAARL